MVHRLHECTTVEHNRHPGTPAGLPVFLLVDLPPDADGDRLFIYPCRAGGHMYHAYRAGEFELVGEAPGHNFCGGRVEQRKPTANPAPPTRL